MGFKLMEEANYYFDAKKEGWIYSWTEKFVLENIEVLKTEVIEEALTNLPPKEIFSNKEEVNISKQRCEVALKETLEEKQIGVVNKQRSAM